MRPKVLIVEDSSAQAAVLAELSEGLGFEPAVYTTLPMGISQILATVVPALVLLDLRLVDERGRQFADGFQLCREIKRTQPKLPVIIVTAEGDDDACRWAFLQGANAYLQKPFTAEEFRNAINEVAPDLVKNR